MRFLIEIGGDVLAKNNRGFSPVELAEITDNKEVLELVHSAAAGKAVPIEVKQEESREGIGMVIADLMRGMPKVEEAKNVMKS